MESKFSFDFKLNVKIKFTLEIRTNCKRNLALMGHHTPLLKKGTGIAIEILNIRSMKTVQN